MPSLASLASAIGLNSINEKTSYLTIVELDEADKLLDQTALRLQYFPETISDSKEVNWSPKEVPGGSLPLYQWISSGARTLSFTAVFTTDVDFSLEAKKLLDLSVDLRSKLKSDGELNRNVDIRAAVLWLRRFMMPRYGKPDGVTPGPLTNAPRKLQIFMPGTGIGLAGGCSPTMHSGPDFITAIMTACEVEWVQFFPSGMPRIATVSLAFAQIVQFRGVVQFPAPDSNADDLVYKEGSGQIFNYALVGNTK